MGTFIKWGVRPNGCPIVQYTLSHGATIRVLLPLGWLKLEVDPTKVRAHAFVRRRRECVLEGKKALGMAACSIFIFIFFIYYIFKKI
jgi:hypothetical protein